MDTCKALPVVALFLNFIALCVVAHQTRLTTRALRHAEASAQDVRKRMFLDLLPEAGSLIHVMVAFDRWDKELNAFARACEAVIRRGDLGLLQTIAQKSPHTPRGVLDGFTYKHAPAWLQAVYAAGGQHYYGAVGVLATLWDFEADQPTWGVEIDFGAGRKAAERIREHRRSLQELRTLLDQTMPEAFLNAPANLSDLDLLREDYRDEERP